MNYQSQKRAYNYRGLPSRYWGFWILLWHLPDNWHLPRGWFKKK